jgi:hypothetical protein
MYINEKTWNLYAEIIALEDIEEGCVLNDELIHETHPNTNEIIIGEPIK